jgi:THO complex subunit 3
MSYSSDSFLKPIGSDKSIRFWDIRSGKCEQNINLPGENINVAWSPDGQCIAVGNKEDVVSFVDVKTFKVFETINQDIEVIIDQFYIQIQI